MDDIISQDVTKGYIMLPTEEFLTTDEVAKSLKLHPYTVRRLSREGKIPGFKFGGQWRFSKKEIDNYPTNNKK